MEQVKGAKWDATLPELVKHWAQVVPDKLFIQEVDGEGCTYRETHERALKWAGALRASGVDAGSRVSVMLENCVDGRVIWLALAWLRAIDVSVSPVYRGQLLAHALNTARSELLFTDACNLPFLADCAADLKYLKRIIVRDEEVSLPQDYPFEVYTKNEFFKNGEAISDAEPPTLRDIACVVFTSGTTGPSKGVIIPWGELTAGLMHMPLEDFSHDEVNYVTSGANHATGRLMTHMMAYLGGTAVLKATFKTQDFWADVDRYGCTWTQLVGAMSSFLMNQPPREDDDKHSLRHVTMAPIIPELEEFKKRFGLKAFTAYGMSECILPIRSGWDIADPKCSGTVQNAWPYYEVRLVDENDYEVPVGEVGELIIRAREPWSMNLGYLDNPAATAEAWRNGWFHTGDAFRKDENGNFYFVDRVKDAIRRRGENVSSFEVEAEVLAHPDVAECAAIGVPADDLEEEIKIFVVPQPGKTIDCQALIDYLMPRMTRYMIPRYIHVIDALPRTPTQRVKKAELRKMPRDGEWDRMAAKREKADDRQRAEA